VPSLLRRQRRRGDQEVDAASLELSLRREDKNPANDALRTGLAQNVVWIGLENFPCGDRTRDFLDAAVEVDYADQV